MSTARQIDELQNFEVLTIKDTFKSKQHGHQVAYRILRPSVFRKRNIVHLYFCHGAVEYHERHLEFFMKFFEHPQYDVVINMFDLVGHGYSGGSRAYVEDFEFYCMDYIQFLNEVSKKHNFEQMKSGKFFLGAHSLGGLISLKMLLDFSQEIPFEVSGAFLSNPCINSKLKIPNFVHKLMGKFDYGLDKIRIPSHITGKEVSTLAPKGRSFIKDPLISQFMTIGMAREIIKQTKRTKSLSYHMDTPCLFLLSPNDAIVDYNVTKLFIKCVDKSLIKVKEYEDSAHDIFNDRQSSKVEDDIRKWLESFYF